MTALWETRRGNARNNTVIENLFSTLKTERCTRTVYRTREQIRAGVFDYVEQFYNPFEKLDINERAFQIWNKKKGLLLFS